MTYALSPASVPWANVSINPATGEVTVTAVADGNGSQLFTITADDGQAVNNTATDTFTLTVNAVNDAPSFSASGDITVSEDFATTETVTVSPDPVPADVLFHVGPGGLQRIVRRVVSDVEEERFAAIG